MALVPFGGLHDAFDGGGFGGGFGFDEMDPAMMNLLYYNSGYQTGWNRGSRYTWQQIQQLMAMQALMQPRGRRYLRQMGWGGFGGGNPWMGVGGGMGGGMGLMMGAPYGFMAPGMF